MELTEKELLKIIEWATGDDTGTSSEFLCRYMLGIKPNKWGESAPSDAGDRGRCIRLLNLIPQWWDRIDELANLPSRKINVVSNNKLEIREEGWKQQIPLIREQAKETG